MLCEDNQFTWSLATIAWNESPSMVKKKSWTETSKFCVDGCEMCISNSLSCVSVRECACLGIILRKVP